MVFFVPAAFISVILLAAAPTIARRAANSTAESDARKGGGRGSL
jgi:hypothetical protein